MATVSWELEENWWKLKWPRMKRSEFKLSKNLWYPVEIGDKHPEDMNSGLDWQERLSPLVETFEDSKETRDKEQYCSQRHNSNKNSAGFSIRMLKHLSFS